ncbi:hypothetical protein [Arthrobacter sp. SLBN-53]|uniref:hypothetical protein n=1 Tax=Arthrobacter sp. SLBN-53 TaxID=2768412 RepID=UPI001356F461|nr:hypothetical protein [Arthrobacter sp. SLBN-53]
MSMPNGPGGINPSAEFGVSETGISDLPNRTQPNIVEILKSSKFPDTSPWKNPNGILAAGWGMVLSAISGAATNAVNAITQIANFIVHVGATTIEGVGDFLNHAAAQAQTAITNAALTLANLQATWNAAIRGWSGVPNAVGSAEDMEVIFGATRQLQFGQITLADLQNAPENAPFWESPNPFEDVSFIRRDLKPVVTYTATTASMAASGTTLIGATESAWRNPLNNHTHLVTIVPTLSKPVFTIPAGTLALSVIRVKKNRIANMVRFMAGGDTPTGPVLVGLYRIDPITGNQTLVYDYGDVSGEVDTGPLVYECALEMAGDMLVEAGALYAVGILPLEASFTVAAVLRQRSVPDPIIYPQGATELLAGQTALPATITETTLNHDATHCIWVSVGQTVPTTITPVTLIADFDAYSNNGNWVSPAFKNFGTGVWEIVDGALTAGGPPALFATDYKKAFVPLTRCATDNMFAEVVIGSAGWSAEWNGAVVRAGVRCNAEGTAAVVMAIHQQGTGPATVTIESATNIIEAGTPRATSTATFQALPSDRFRIEAVHDPDLDYTTYTCLRNGEPIAGAQWPDIDNLSPRGVAWRRAMGGSNAATWNFALQRAAAIDLFRAGDLST